MPSGVTSNFEQTPFPSPGSLKSELAQTTRPTIAKRLVEVAKGKIGRRQGRVKGALTGYDVPEWPQTRTSHNLLRTGKHIRDRIRAEVSGVNINFGVTGNARYGMVQRAQEFGARIAVRTREGFFIAGRFVQVKKETTMIVIRPRSYIRGTVYALEKWMQNQVLEAMKKSMKNLKRRG